MSMSVNQLFDLKNSGDLTLCAGLYIDYNAVLTISLI